MAGKDNLKGKGFDSRTTEELREIARKGGQKSGEARRRKANFKKTLNMILTAEIINEDWTPFLESIGIDSTIEAVVNAAMVREAMLGNVKAYEAIAKYFGQDRKTEKENREQDMKMEAYKMRAEKMKKEMEPENKDVEVKVVIDEDWSV